jgi:alkaline phosphatase
MRRRDFFRKGALAATGAALVNPLNVSAFDKPSKKIKAKNVIFLVSDGMSAGTLNMADLLLQQQFGRTSTWIQLYKDNRVKRALMDTASANSLVTDSAAASSSWGGGKRVNNGSLNIGPNGEEYKPILQKFKSAGKSVGCVTTVQITHATPAGFCVNSQSRGSMDEIAEQYMKLRFDVMMGGGTEVFSADKRKDKRDMFSEYTSAGFQVARSKTEMNKMKPGTPVMAVFGESGLPFTLDHQQDTGLKEKVPTLAEMTLAAINQMKNNPKGFALQVEGGKVDWAAHSNDTGGLLYDQIAFDEAIKVAIDFAEADKETLVIITTDHGNANPGLFGGKNFDKIQKFKHTNDWILNGINVNTSVSQVIERIEFAQGIVIKPQNAWSLLESYAGVEENGIYNPKKLPFEKLAKIQASHTSISWASMDHSGDFVELAAFGPGSELLNSFVKNTDLHELILTATEVKS